MDLILDGEEMCLDVSNCANLAELVAAAEASERGDGEESVVVAVEIDGETLSPEALSGMERQSLEGVGRVSIQRRPTRTVAYSVLEQGADYTAQICGAIDQTVEHFRSARSDRGNQILADVTDSLTVLTGITSSLAPVLGEAAEELSSIQGELFPWLQELVEAQTEEDPLRIADLLEYEVKPRIGAWGKVMRVWAEPGRETACEGKAPLSN